MSADLGFHSCHTYSVDSIGALRQFVGIETGSMLPRLDWSPSQVLSFDFAKRDGVSLPLPAAGHE
jgi:hypothetical protein